VAASATTKSKKTQGNTGNSRLRSAAESAQVDGWEPVNDVAVVGRISSVGEVVTLPSGSQVISVRVVVPRADGRSDVFDCSAWTAVLRRKVASWRIGDVVSLEGQMRRRFWRAGTIPSSRWDLEIAVASRILKSNPT
jgi:single-strand DNA-binding protein